MDIFRKKWIYDIVYISISVKLNGEFVFWPINTKCVLIRFFIFLFSWLLQYVTFDYSNKIVVIIFIGSGLHLLC